MIVFVLYVFEISVKDIKSNTVTKKCKCLPKFILIILGIIPSHFKQHVTKAE